VNDGHTLFMFVADHGHCQINHPINLAEHPEARPIFDAMRGGRGGAARFTYLYLREGTRRQVIETLQTHFADCLAYVDVETALQHGLFGQGELHPEIRHRIGDIILLSRSGWYVTDHISKSMAKSRHGGLSDWEMLVPLVWKQI
jgi:hypothetical protein